jgi:hypothetical protein
LHSPSAADQAPSWRDRFSDWWPTYRKGRRQAALKRWLQIKPQTADQFATITAGTAKYLASRRVQDGFKLDAEKFLSQCGWDFEDEPARSVEW